MTGELDPRLSDEATGLPPLVELGDDGALRPVALGDLLRHHLDAVERLIAVERQARR